MKILKNDLTLSEAFPPNRNSNREACKTEECIQRHRRDYRLVLHKVAFGCTENPFSSSAEMWLPDTLSQLIPLFYLRQTNNIITQLLDRTMVALRKHFFEILLQP